MNAGLASTPHTTFFEVVPGGPLSITDVTPGDCDIEVGTHAGH